MIDPVIYIHKLIVQSGEHLTLNDLNFSVSEGEFISIVGPNGGGKTTLIKVIIGLIKPSSGEIKVFGLKPEDVGLSMIGYVPQIKLLDRSFPAKAEELVATGIIGRWPVIMNKELKRKVAAALDRVSASNLANRRISCLSGGELQRVYLARGIIRQPRLLLLDEPATGIDYAGEKDINHFLDDYKKEEKAAILMVTHDWESAFHHADRILLLNREQIALDTPKLAFSEENLRYVFGHIGHKHEMIFGAKHD